MSARGDRLHGRRARQHHDVHDAQPACPRPGKGGCGDARTEVTGVVVEPHAESQFPRRLEATPGSSSGSSKSGDRRRNLTTRRCAGACKVQDSELGPIESAAQLYLSNDAFLPPVILWCFGESAPPPLQCIFSSRDLGTVHDTDYAPPPPPPRNTARSNFSCVCVSHMYAPSV